MDEEVDDTFVDKYGKENFFQDKDADMDVVDTFLDEIVTDTFDDEDIQELESVFHKCVEHPHCTPHCRQFVQLFDNLSYS